MGRLGSLCRADQRHVRQLIAVVALIKLDRLITCLVNISTRGARYRILKLYDCCRNDTCRCEPLQLKRYIRLVDNADRVRIALYADLSRRGRRDDTTIKHGGYVTSIYSQWIKDDLISDNVVVTGHPRITEIAIDRNFRISLATRIERHLVLLDHGLKRRS